MESSPSPSPGVCAIAAASAAANARLRSRFSGAAAAGGGGAAWGGGSKASSWSERTGDGGDGARGTRAASGDAVSVVAAHANPAPGAVEGAGASAPPVLLLRASASSRLSRIRSRWSSVSVSRGGGVRCWTPPPPPPLVLSSQLAASSHSHVPIAPHGVCREVEKGTGLPSQKV
jgi:hypothetical protein